VKLIFEVVIFVVIMLEEVILVLIRLVIVEFVEFVLIKFPEPLTSKCTVGLDVLIPIFPPTSKDLKIDAPPIIVIAPPRVMLDAFVVQLILNPPLYNTTDPVDPFVEVDVEYNRNSP
jgi:hypothetical protein